VKNETKITILGSGTSYGVPIPGCTCKTCSSSLKENKRTRASLYIESDKSKVLIDTSKDLWTQFKRENITDVDTVIYTHAHADHILGIDDLRFINVKKKKRITAMGRPETINEIRRMFNYIFMEEDNQVSKPKIDTKFFLDETKDFNGIKIEAVTLDHTCMNVNGYIIEDQVAYFTDVKRINDSIIKKIKDIPYLILGCIFFDSHNNHLNLSEALDLIKLINPKTAYLTHSSHIFEYNDIKSKTPDNVNLAYDGLNFCLKTTT
jgi:phosphoribosyl 1,2-cyclic phosphate phosphodiesterase